MLAILERIKQAVAAKLAAAKALIATYNPPAPSEEAPVEPTPTDNSGTV